MNTNSNFVFDFLKIYLVSWANTSHGMMVTVITSPLSTMISLNIISVETLSFFLCADLLTKKNYLFFFSFYFNIFIQSIRLTNFQNQQKIFFSALYPYPVLMNPLPVIFKSLKTVKGLQNPKGPLRMPAKYKPIFTKD